MIYLVGSHKYLTLTMVSKFWCLLLPVVAAEERTVEKK